MSKMDWFQISRHSFDSIKSAMSKPIENKCFIKAYKYRYWCCVLFCIALGFFFFLSHPIYYRKCIENYKALSECHVHKLLPANKIFSFFFLIYNFLDRLIRIVKWLQQHGKPLQTCKIFYKDEEFYPEITVMVNRVYSPTHWLTQEFSEVVSELHTFFNVIRIRMLENGSVRFKQTSFVIHHMPRQYSSYLLV